MTADVRPLELTLAGVALTPGTRWVEAPAGAKLSEKRSFVLSVPDDPSSPRPLVVFLHGGAGTGKLVQRIECLVKPGLARVAPIVVAPEGGRGDWWKKDETSFVLGLVDAALRDWPQLRRDRVVVMGYSNGGIGTWFFARLYPERFSAAIPMASNHAIVGETPLPVWAIHGSDDDLFDVTRVAESVAMLTKQGLPVSLHVRPGGTHNDPCPYVPELQAAALWLEQEVWNAAP